MKNSVLRYLFLLLLTVSATLFGQSDISSLVISNTGQGQVVPTGNGFRVDMAINYNTQNINHNIVVDLPSTVFWNLAGGITNALSVDVTTTTVSGIDDLGVQTIGSASYHRYKIRFVPKVVNGQTKVNTNIYINDLRNDRTAICSGSQQDNLYFQYLTGTSSLGTSDALLFTPQQTDVNPLLDVSASCSPQELDNGAASGKFPMYVDIAIDWRDLTKLPALRISFPSRLQLLTAVEFVGGGTFHTEKVYATTMITATNYSIELPSTASTYFHGGRMIRVYFKATSDGIINAEDIEVSARDAEYQLCSNPAPQLYGDKVSKVPSGSFSVKQNVSPLSATIHQVVSNPTFCPLNCNYSLSSQLGVYDVEVNSLYQSLSSIPAVRIKVPFGVVTLSGITVPAGTSVTYTVFGSSSPVTLSAGTFPANTNVEYVYINSYAAAGSSFQTNLQLSFYYKQLNLSGTPLASKSFSVEFVGYSNTNAYASAATEAANSCDTRLYFWDDYENSNDQQFYSYVDYNPGQRTQVRLTITPINNQYGGSYAIVNSDYYLDPGMELDINSVHDILFSETGSNYKLLRGANTGVNFTNISLALHPDRGGIRINNITLDNDVTVNGTSTCTQNKNLYLIIPVRVKSNTTYTASNKNSSFTHPGVFYVARISSWNIRKSDFNKVTTSLSMICPSDRQEYNAFAQGQLVAVRYLVQNANQNYLQNIVMELPGLQQAVLEAGSQFESVMINVNGGVSVRENFTVQLYQPNGIRVISNDNYKLPGFSTLAVEVFYLLNTPLTTGESGITFATNFKNVNGNTIENLRPSVTESYSISATATCIPLPPCSTCVTSLSPVPGHEYLLSAWVKEGYSATTIPPKTYQNTGLRITFNDGNLNSFPLYVPKGPVIDGWQRIEYSFVIPATAFNIQIEMVNNGDNPAYFDDIRIHPFRSNMKSFVYDPATQRLVAELDENNYATFYEYDDEGALVRVKKETQRGVMTITESRNNQSKTAVQKSGN